ncbi:MAG: hypothetical protein AAF772_08555 [Acidobacteriota bacterium]
MNISTRALLPRSSAARRHRATRWGAVGLALLLSLVGLALAGAAHADDAAADTAVRTAVDATIDVYLSAPILEDLGLELRQAPDLRTTQDERGRRIRFQLTAPAPWALRFTALNDGFQGFVGGALELPGPLVLRGDSSSRETNLRFDRVVMRPVGDRDAVTLGLFDADGALLFTLDHIHSQLDVAANRLELRNMDLRVAPALAERLGRTELIGLSLGGVDLRAHTPEPSSVITNPNAVVAGGCSTPDFTLPIDVALTTISSIQQVAREAGVRVAISPSATLENVGQGDVPWYQAFTTPSDQHPYLVWSMYRIEPDDGTLRQIGQSNVKHAFYSINSGCGCPGGQILWVGCGDTYGVFTNDNPTWLAPRGEVEAFTGTWNRCGSLFDPDCNGVRNSAPTADDFDRRMVVEEPDLQVAGAQYLFESWYIVQEDINILNSMRHRAVNANLNGSSWIFSPTSDVEGPAIDSWVSQTTNDPNEMNRMFTTAEGAVQLAVRATVLPDSRTRFRYALMNHDFDRRVRQVRIPLSVGAAVTDVASWDIDNDPSNDWTVSVTADAVIWTAPVSEGVGVNEIDWNTLHSFGFTVDRTVTTGQMTVTPSESGAPSELSLITLVPSGVSAEVFSDSFESATTGAWSSTTN